MVELLSDEEIQQKLAKPGAGIPWANRVILRFVFKPLIMKRGTWELSARRNELVVSKFAHELHSIPDNLLAKRILVNPQRGLEDSSRYWSAAMTARHVVIVTRNIERVVVMLSQGHLPNGIADTAKVKPELDMNDVAAVREFDEFIIGLTSRIEQAVKDRESKLSYSHPWFGPMTAKDWFWLIGAHTAVHVKQLRQIKVGLGIS